MDVSGMVCCFQYDASDPSDPELEGTAVYYRIAYCFSILSVTSPVAFVFLSNIKTFDSINYLYLHSLLSTKYKRLYSPFR